MPPITQEGYKQLSVFFGDLHNHCEVSYGHGSLEEAFANAKLQLDFVSVTLHAAWPDIPSGQEELKYLVDYHKNGFEKAKQNWALYLKTVEEFNQEGEFIIYPSFEWHSNNYGDHCIYYQDGIDHAIIEETDLNTLHARLKSLPTQSLLIPHHIGYKKGYRGINWSDFSDHHSPVVEIFSFHGSSESSDSGYPYLHTMGPRHGKSCAQHGWSLGNIFGVIGSTDHHNAFPGSYGYGRLGVWSPTLTRESIWDAINNRHTYALTGDRIQLKLSLNSAVMGDVCPYEVERRIVVDVIGGDTIDYIDVVYNNRILHREFPNPSNGHQSLFKVYLELGWGEKQEETHWDVVVQVLNGNLRSVEPRFRGLSPSGVHISDQYAFSHWEQIKKNEVSFTTRSRPNTSLHTPTTQGMCFEIEGDKHTTILAYINGKSYQHQLSDLFSGTRTHYLGGFVSPAICFHRAIPDAEYHHQFEFIHHQKSNQRDWYYVRVRQNNNQWAWSSPIWVDAPNE